MAVSACVPDWVARLAKLRPRWGLDEKRLKASDDDLAPFEPGAVAVLRTVSNGRVGLMLSKAYGLFHGAAEAG